MNSGRWLLIWLLLLSMHVFRATEAQAFEANLAAGMGGMLTSRGGSLGPAFSLKAVFFPNYFLKPWLETSVQRYSVARPTLSSGLSFHGGLALDLSRVRLRAGIGATRLRVADSESGLSATEYDVSTTLGFAVALWGSGTWRLWSDLKLENMEFAGITAACGGISLSREF